MSILICSTKYGGCGYVGENHTFKLKVNHAFCPQCYGDHCVFQLSDENFERLVDEFNRDKARKMLDKEHAAIHGNHLRFCVDNGFILKANLTEEQKEELGYV
jgi:hypothetical protein